MIGRTTDIFQIIMLATNAHALLGISDATRLWLSECEEVILELVHSSVGEQQSRITNRNQGCAWDDEVTLAAEEIQELLTDLRAGGLLGHA